LKLAKVSVLQTTLLVFARMTLQIGKRLRIAQDAGYRTPGAEHQQ